MIKRFLNARMMLTLGLMSLVTSAFLLISFLGFIPDKTGLQREARMTISELVAASSMASLASNDTDAIVELMQFVVERRPELRSTAIRRADGEIVAGSDKHTQLWNGNRELRSTDTEVIVPLFSGGKQWGQAELAFTPLSSGSWFSFLFDDRMKAAALLGAICFVAFYFFLGKMLKALDPSRAVPDRVRTALDTLAESLLLVDRKGQIVLANQSFAALVGQPPEDLLGKKSTSFEWLNKEGSVMIEDDLPWLQALAIGELRRNVAIAIVDSDGNKRSFLTNCAPIAGGSEQTVNGVMISMDDVTELEEKEFELRQARETAESANQAKTDFLANMSHEIRTPMNAVLGFTELMRRNKSHSATESAQYLETISRNGKHLLSLINDILDLSKVESGEVEIEKTETSPHQIVHEVIEILMVRATEKGIGLRFEVNSDVPESMTSDPARIRQILTNLIGNSIKFTESGEVVVTETLVESDGQSGIEIGIRDTGIGIPADKLLTIFEPFTQAESSTTRRFGGTGLGLTISRKFARAMGGDIVANSETGKGSEFVISLPVDPADQPLTLISSETATTKAVHVNAGPSIGWQFSGQRVLVVDDSPENRQLVSLVLEDAGLNISLANNGAEGCEKALNSEFDLILMDMQMPVMDGSTATRKLRAAGLKTKIYAFTAHALSGFESEIAEIGCDGFLTKPIDIDHMLDLLGKLLGGTRVDIGPNTHASSENTDSSESRIESRLAGNERLRQIISAFVERLPDQISKMRTAFDSQDHETLAQLAHWLKGSAGSVGFDDFTEPARTLEEMAKARQWAEAMPYFNEIENLSSRIISPMEPDTGTSDELNDNLLLTENGI